MKIDLSKAVEGKQSFVITDENINLPKGITLLDVVPPSLEINLASIVKKEILIKPQLVGKLHEGLEIRAVEVKPEKVTALLPS